MKTSVQVVLVNTYSISIIHIFLEPLGSILEYCYFLKYEERPSYDFIIRLFELIMNQHCSDSDIEIYDWNNFKNRKDLYFT